MSRSFMKLFYKQNSEKERIEYVDESINELVRSFMDCDNSHKREYHKSELTEIRISDQILLINQSQIHTTKQ